MNSRYQPVRFPTARERCVDIVRRWLTACGKGSCRYTVELLAELTDEQLADRCICGWGLDQPQGDDNDITWFEANNADREMLIEAFAAARAAFRGSASKI